MTEFVLDLEWVYETFFYSDSETGSVRSVRYRRMYCDM